MNNLYGALGSKTKIWTRQRTDTITKTVIIRDEYGGYRKGYEKKRGNRKRKATEDYKPKKIRLRPMFAMEDRRVTAITIWTDHMSCLKYLLWLHPLVTLYQYHSEQPRPILFSFSCPRWRKRGAVIKMGYPSASRRRGEYQSIQSSSAMGRILNSQILGMHSNPFPLFIVHQRHIKQPDHLSSMHFCMHRQSGSPSSSGNPTGNPVCTMHPQHLIGA